VFRLQLRAIIRPFINVEAKNNIILFAIAAVNKLIQIDVVCEQCYTCTCVNTCLGHTLLFDVVRIKLVT